MLSKIVPRPAGSTIGAVACPCASRESDDARTVEIHDARASSAPKTRRMHRSSSRMREFTTRATPLLPRELEVARVGRRRWDIAEPVGCLLDPLRGRSARDLGRKGGILRLKFDLGLVEPADPHVHLEDDDVQRYDAGQHDRECRDPGDAAADA